MAVFYQVGDLGLAGRRGGGGTLGAGSWRGDSHVRGPSVVCHPRKTVGGRVRSVLPALCNTHTDTHTQIYRHTHTQRQRYTETHI